MIAGPLTIAVALLLVLAGLLMRWDGLGLLAAHPGCCACGAFDMDSPDDALFANGTVHAPGGCS